MPVNSGNSAPERDILREVLLAGSSHDRRLWRQQVGTFYSGRMVSMGGKRFLAEPRATVIGTPGMSDAYGLVSVEITPDMVGRRVAVFCAVETKTATGNLSGRQEGYLGLIQALGGRAGVARSAEEAVRIMGG